jgi:hypothetical protein
MEELEKTSNWQRRKSWGAKLDQDNGILNNNSLMWIDNWFELRKLQKHTLKVRAL